ncbi:MAG: replication protein [Candidatus Phlomobacter fragariae]
MAAIVTSLDDYRVKNEVRENTVAEIENGYTRIANELLEAIAGADLTVRQIKILLTIVRKTYGFGKKLDRIINTQIAEITSIHHTHVCKAKNEIISMNILILEKGRIGINKKIFEWNFNISQNS